MYYDDLGVSAQKQDVHVAIKNIDQGLFPGAFCKAIPDIFSGSSQHCLLSHSDGAGTKSILAYLHYKTYGDPNIFKGIAQDSLVMNLDDLLCVGAIGPYIMSNTIGRNSTKISGEIIKAIIDGYQEFIDMMSPYIEIIPCGGETADMGDIIRTIVVDSTLTTSMRISDFIDCCELPQP